MNWRGQPLIVMAGRGIGPFELGQTREQVQALTREPIESCFPQEWSKVRSDEHPHLGVTVSYDDDGVANHIAGFVQRRGGKSTLTFEGEPLRDATRETLSLLLELLGAAAEDVGEALEVPSLGLKFGLREDDEPSASDACEYVVVTPKPG
jgi:hypothetical protein